MKLKEEKGVAGTIMPVPRSLSSSCDTCVAYDAEVWDQANIHGEIEQIVKDTGKRYQVLYRAEYS